MKTLFDDHRMTWEQALDFTADSLRGYGTGYSHWCIAWSGGKDSTAVLTVTLYLIAAGLVGRPERITVCYADTRMELPPLSYAAMVIIEQLRAQGIDVRVVMAPLDRRFFVYMLGRGVPPPNNNTFRWCTRQIKVEPMHQELRRIVGSGQQVLMLTGVRQGESAARDARIAISCGKNGSECGQGWYQEMTGDGFSTLAPILHWRVCHVWDWLKMAQLPKWGGFETWAIADAYGHDEAEENNARTGCVGCPLASKDVALDAVVQIPSWSHLAPLKELRPIYRTLREPQNRLRQPGGETRKDGSLTSNQHRMGPLTMPARLWALDSILDIQRRCNNSAAELRRPAIDILNSEEEARIRELIEMKTWPRKWTGDEPTADEPYEEADAAGMLQASLFGN